MDQRIEQFCIFSVNHQAKFNSINQEIRVNKRELYKYTEKYIFYIGKIEAKRFFV